LIESLEGWSDKYYTINGDQTIGIALLALLALSPLPHFHL
jgi:hypothetical protein